MSPSNSQNPANLVAIGEVLGLIDRQVWVVTAANGGLRSGLTATWVCPASSDPARPGLVLGLTPGHLTAELIHASGLFAAHLLRPDQTALAWNFARDSGRIRDKFVGLELESHAADLPVLSDCLAWCDCRVFARYDAGDRRLFWADMISAVRLSDGIPLGEREFLRSLSTDQRHRLAASRASDMLANRPAYELWRHSFPDSRT